MTEQYSHLNNFDPAQVRDALAAETHTSRDLALGLGHVVAIDDSKTMLEVFPDTGVARVTTEHARVEIHRVPGYSVDADKNRVVFEQGNEDDRTRLIVRSDGKVSFYPVLKATESPRTGQTQEADTKPRAVSPTPPEANTTAPSTSTETSEVPAVTLQGRLGRDPWFRPGEHQVAGFPLAVNMDDRTIWHKVVVFDETAVTLEEQARKGDIRKGRLVEVSGRPVIREEQTARGTKKNEEFHASEVNRVRTTRRQ